MLFLRISAEKPDGKIEDGGRPNGNVGGGGGGGSSPDEDRGELGGREIPLDRLVAAETTAARLAGVRGGARPAAAARPMAVR